jgi:hypothetical protein
VGLVRNAQERKSLGLSCIWFTVTPAGEVLCPEDPSCVMFYVDELENRYCIVEDKVLDSNGMAHPLSFEPPLTPGVHSKPGGGFWVVSLNDDYGVNRWTVHPDGMVTLDGTYHEFPGAQLTLGFGIDEEGAGYATAYIGDVGGIIRYSADFQSSEVVITDSTSPCKLGDFGGMIYSTP